MRRFDTHVHLWRRGDGHAIRIRSRFPELDRDFGIGELLPHLKAAMVDRIVLVSAAQNEREPAGLLEIARAQPGLVAGVIGWLDLGDPRFAEKVEKLSSDPLWLGIRLPIVLEDATLFAASAGVDSALEHLASIDALVQVLISPQQIAAVAPVLERHAGLRMVIDHAANPKVLEPISAEWREGIHRLARLPNAVCKISAFWLPGEPLPTDNQVSTCLGEIVGAFGTDRIVQASNWPLTPPGTSNLQTFMRQERLTGISAAQFHENAERTYRRPRAAPLSID